MLKPADGQATSLPGGHCDSFSERSVAVHDCDANLDLGNLPVEVSRHEAQPKLSNTVRPLPLVGPQQCLGTRGYALMINSYPYAATFHDPPRYSRAAVAAMSAKEERVGRVLSLRHAKHTSTPAGLSSI